ncbi:MAG: PilN domain-containing protein [Thermoleophilia bacterium]|nr:PilN domain-containing protein [Thermoleophilia bacterium]
MARRINLVPASERPRTTTDVGLLGLLALVIVVIFGLGFGYYLLSSSLSDRKHELADLQAQVSQLEVQVANLRAYERLQAQRVNVEKVVQSIFAGRTLVGNILDDLSLVVPENVWFQSLALTTADPGAAKEEAAAAGGARTSTAVDTRMSIEGNTYTFEDVAVLLVRLQLIPELANIHLVSAGEPKGNTDPAKNVRGFTVDADVVNKQPADTPLPVSKVEVP